MTSTTATKKEMTSSITSNNRSLGGSSGGVGGGGSGGGGGGGGGDGLHIPLVHDALTFDCRQALRLEEMEKRVDEEIKKRTREWDRDVEHMREEFLELHPCDKQWGSEEVRYFISLLFAGSTGRPNLFKVNRPVARVGGPMGPMPHHQCFVPHHQPHQHY